MSDPQENIDKRRRILERLLGMIPGYKQYQEQEKRRDADKKNREFLYEDLKQVLSDLEECALKLANDKSLDQLADLDRSERKLRTVADRIRLADYGYAGFFDAFKIQEEELDRLYEFDLKLAQQVEKIKSGVDGLIKSGRIPEGLDEVNKLIDDLGDYFNQRERAIMEVS